MENGEVTLTLTLTNGQQTITDDMTLTINRMVVIENAIPEPHYCAIVEPQEIGVTLTGNYVNFGWTTAGDGTFGDPSEPMTTYTPGEQDIVNGSVMLTAEAEAPGCGGAFTMIPFQMTPMVVIENAIAETCPNTERMFYTAYTHLPLYPLTEEQLKYQAQAVVEAVREMKAGR